MKARLNRDLVRLLLPLGFSTLLLVVLLCGLAQAIEPGARASFAAPARATNRPNSLDYQTGVPICQQTRNLVPDPGFDQGIGMYAHWHCEGECSFQADQPGHDSDPSAVIFGQPGEGECRLVTPVGEIYVEPDRWYDYGAWMRTGLLDGDTFLRIKFYRWQDGWEAIPPYAYTNVVTDTGGVWVRVTGSAQAPPDAEYARVEVVLPASSAGSVWVDDVFFGLATCLDISKYDEPDPVSPGEMLTYTIIYSNTGREGATDVRIVEDFDECVAPEWAQPPPTWDDVWHIPELPPGASGTITVVVRVVEDAEECARILNCVHIRSDETEDLIYTCISTSIVPDGCDIALYLPDKGKSGEPGYPVNYDLVLCNFGRCDGWAYLTATSSLDGDVVSVPSPPYSLPVGSCVQATVSISVPQEALSGTVDVAVITATLTCGPPCNETATAAVTLTTTVTSIPLTGVTIDGPTGGYVNTPYTFTATVTPTTATLPIACTWSPTPALGQGCALVTYTWSTTGPKTITITATNAGGTVSHTHPFLVEWRKIYLPLVLRH